MGVHGLWKLIESSGKPVPLETLENKVLAVDVSIWLHQAIKGFQDNKGAPVANAHLLGIYHRVCKLLYFKIKPIFVFDGGVPALKRQTIAKRNQNKSKNASEADRLQRQLISTLLKHTAISKVLSEKTKASLPLPKKSNEKYDNLYGPPSAEIDSPLSSDEEVQESSNTKDSSPTKQWDLHTIDTTSHYFQSLPLETKHEILTDLKETRKQSSWGRLHQLPKQSDDFSNYQMKRLLERQEVQSALDNVSKEMGGMSLSLVELESLLKDQGIKTTNDTNFGKRIVSDNNTRYLYIKDIQKEIKKAEEAEEYKNKIASNIDDEEEKELKEAIQLSLQETPSTSSNVFLDLKKKTKSDVEEDGELQKVIQLSLGKEVMSNEIKKGTQLSLQETTISTSESSGLKKNHKADLEEKGEVQKSTSTNESSDLKKKTKADLEEEDELQKAIQLSLEENPHSNEQNPNLEIAESLNDVGDYQSESDRDYQSESDGDFLCEFEDFKEPLPKVNKKMSSAQNYMLEYSGLTPAEINKIIGETKNVNLDKNLNNTKFNKSKVESVIQFPQFKSPDLDHSETELKEKSHNICIQTISEVKNKENQNINSEERQHNETVKDVEIMSDSSESDDENFCTPKESLEIVIDPNNVETDDLFGDIFEDIKDTKDSLLIKQDISNKSIPLEADIESNHENNHISILKRHINEKKSVDNSKKESCIEEQDGLSYNSIGKYSVNDKNIAENVQNEKTPKENNQVDTCGKKPESEIDVNNKNFIPTVPKLTIQEMQELKDNLLHEKIDILREKSNKERLANNITDQMYQEAQELLELFGVPYIIAPMEAEAQCAFLDEVELTNGTITDDSDIWLFGGKTVYKNFFNQSKYVMEFKSENIEHHFKLNRKQMILLALLVGSDYTIGLQGVGPVTALEILSIFPPIQSQEITLSNQQLLSGLKEFKSWYLKGKAGGLGRSSLKNKLKNVTFGDHFPNHQVVEAYLDPKIETSRTPFSWGKPDITGLTVFAKEKFAWTMKKTEDILNPVIKKLEENKSQTSIRDYFRTQFKVDTNNIEGKVSKRIKNAIDRIGKSPDELIAEEMIELEKAKDKANGNKHKVSQRSKSNKNTNNKEETKTDSNKSVKEKTRISVSNKDEKIGTEHSVVPNEIRKRKSTKDKKDNSEKRNKPSTSRASKIKANEKELDKDLLCESTSKSLPLEQVNELKDYENIAMELKMRRKRKNELKKLKVEPSKKKSKVVIPPILEKIPEELEGDEEIQILTATTSRSNRLVQEITEKSIKALEASPSTKKVIPKVNFHKNDIIHQRLRDKSNLLRNKMKAIEIFRKSKKGPGYVSKSKKTVILPKEDAGLSEDSD